MGTTPLLVREARIEDLDSIMQVEKQYGALVGGQPSMAPRDLMASRIETLNQPEHYWFFVAEQGDGVAVSYIILQPTDLAPDECRSWRHATDNGTLASTFNPAGENIFGVSMARRQGAPQGSLEILVHHSLVVKHREKLSGHYYFCAPMRGFERASARSRVRPEDYWSQKRKDGTYHDHMLEEFRLMFGEGPCRLLRNGYLPDAKSGGHAVLYVVKDATSAALSIGARLYRAGFLAGKALQVSGKE